MSSLSEHRDEISALLSKETKRAADPAVLDDVLSADSAQALQLLADTVARLDLDIAEERRRQELHEIELRQAAVWRP